MLKLHQISRTPLSLACLALAAPWALAQNAVAPPGAASPVVITGNPLGNAPGAAPASVLAGEALVLRRGSTRATRWTACPACRPRLSAPTPAGP